MTDFSFFGVWSIVEPVPSCGLCLSVTFMYRIETSKNILKLFSPCCGPDILVFPFCLGNDKHRAIGTVERQ